MLATRADKARYIPYGHDDYPALLQYVHDAPPILVVKGQSELWKNMRCIAMVGARNASASGCKFAQKLAAELSDAGVTVVSGLARGIDSFSHRGALEAGTVGVIAGGIDTLYPPENAPLYQRMAETGAIISEQPIGQQPIAASFPARNRIIAGMSHGTLVVEAAPRSGSLITARLAGEYNRELFAVPGSPMDPRSKGCNKLLRDGAHLVESADDVLQVFQQQQHSLQEPPEPIFKAEPPRLNDAELASLRLKLLDKLGTIPVSVDELIEQCQTSAQYVNAVILELELAGRLTRSSGNTVSLSTEMEEVA